MLRLSSMLSMRARHRAAREGACGEDCGPVALSAVVAHAVAVPGWTAANGDSGIRVGFSADKGFTAAAYKGGEFSVPDWL
ncbi:MAG: hypothetical protein CMJ72_04220 [Planctomycetaceae bacterium]|nr:hypothetical protein [Planctomycetaceae bacterium]HCK42320.1 hypothetical protein [Planctomycetaceae bacterium]